MPKTKSRHNGSKDNEETRLVAAQTFQAGDRVRHKLTGRFGIFLEINLGFALPEVWVQFESDIECSVPVSCNPLELELVNTENTEASELPSYSAESESEPYVTVEQPSTAVSLGELTSEEVAERHRLELKVEKAFYEAGAALRELRDKRLYRSTHKTFEEYCKDRFGFSRQNANYLIAGASVLDNLLNLTTNRCQNQDSDQMTTIRCQILPTKLEQTKPLAKLQPDEQLEVWLEAVEQAGGKVPSGRIVKGIVERLKERGSTPPLIPYSEGDVVLIRGLGNPDLRKFDGQWAIALQINEYSVTVALGGKDVPVKPQFLEPVDPKYWADIKAVHERITRLQQYDLDPMEDAGLEVLLRRTCFTPKQLTLLKFLEQQYGIE